MARRLARRDAGLVAPDAAARWLSRWQKAQARGSGEDARPFAGLVVAVAPFPSSNRIERDMLVEVLRAGGARVSTVSAKGALIPAAPAPDVAVVDPGSFAGADAAAGRAGRRRRRRRGRRVRRSRVLQELALAARCQPGAARVSAARWSARSPTRSRARPARAPRRRTKRREPPAPRSRSRAGASPRGEASGASAAKAAEAAASEVAGGSGTKRVSAKDRAVPIVGKRRRVLAPRN